jgi:predicted metallo-beta-lactamase superfamily hydrolase
VKIIPIAFDSLGVRSMATLIETEGLKIIIDPSVRLAPLRYNLPPHPIEIKRMKELWEKIVSLAYTADLAIVTHYHYDHHNPEYPELFKNKITIVKNPKDKINYNQQSRAQDFLDKISPLVKELLIADGNTFQRSGITIKCSPAVFHGISDYTGYVFETLITDHKEKVIFSSDICGAIEPDQLLFILEGAPDFLIVDGPTNRYSQEFWETSLRNLIKIISETNVKTIILDHHIMRDLRYQEYFAQIKSRLSSTQRNISVITAAEYLGEKNLLLEIRRKELYQKYPTAQSSDFTG